MLADFCIFIARHYLFSQELLRARGEIFVASDRQFLVQPLALRTPTITAWRVRWPHIQSLGEGARSGNAGTLATLHLARNQAGGAKSEAFWHRHHAAFRRARARSPPALSRLALDARIGERWC